MKRGLDIIFSTLLLSVLWPLLIIIYLCIKIDSHGPAIFKQKRIGQCNRIFIIYKFRTMKFGTPDKATNEIDHSLVVTRIGKFLRKSSLDELPQLINILKGDMSFVGPRPALYNQYELIEMREKAGVHIVKPGITGLAQVNGRDYISDIEKVKWDKMYVEQHNLLLDLKIILKTFSSVIVSKNISG